ncbi:cell division protein FtsQ [Vibrio ponticus]|uniref:Cell division protein FtsQ n=2 Tax=Vibrio ponticus TaxID=265668 RepID=A0ABX3FHN0_9VIBR|nr:cell division protein FtsQ/DivIB [Vibrio ponticus]OLQ92711.1 cell division protein FtsQ [Vibrio ponticus]
MISTPFPQDRRLKGFPVIKEHLVGGSFFVMVIVLIGSLLFSTVSWMWDDQRLPLSKLVLQGELEYVTALDVQRAFSTLDHVGTFMSQDIDVLQGVIEQIPWVSHVSIRKQWPDTIKVFLTEHHASAIWNGDALLDSNGQIFNGDLGKLKGDRVKLYGPEGSNLEVLQTWQRISQLFEPLGLTITSLVLNDRRAWQIILDNGIRLELGKESLDERINRFISLYNSLGSDAQRVSYIDLRYDTGAAVGWFPEQESEQESTDDEDR